MEIYGIIGTLIGLALIVWGANTLQKADERFRRNERNLNTEVRQACRTTNCRFCPQERLQHRQDSGTGYIYDVYCSYCDARYGCGRDFLYDLKDGDLGKESNRPHDWCDHNWHLIATASFQEGLKPTKPYKRSETFECSTCHKIKTDQGVV